MGKDLAEDVSGKTTGGVKPFFCRATKLNYYATTTIPSRHSRAKLQAESPIRQHTLLVLSARSNSFSLRIREHPFHQPIERSLVQRLGEHVGQHIFRRDVLEHDFTVVDVFLDETVSDEDVLGTAEPTASGCLHVHRGLVVLPRLHGADIAVAEVVQQTCEPQRISDAVRESVHLRFGRR